MKTTSAGLSLLLALASAGCAGDEKVAPTDPPPSDTIPDGEAGGPPDPGPAVRSVFLRNPIGTPFDNLLADGDFELSIVPEQAAGGQYGWRAFRTNGSEVALGAETGGLCRSGIRCARLGDGAILLGQGTAAPGNQPHRASLWVKAVDPAKAPANKPCDLLDGAYLIECSSFDVVGSLKAADGPTTDGWCEYADRTPSSRAALCMYVELADVEVLLDAATLLPDLEPSPLPSPLPVVPDAALRDRLTALRGWIRGRMPLSSDSLPYDDEGRPRDPRLRAKTLRGD